MTRILAILSLLAGPCATHHGVTTARHRATVRAYERAHPCPGGNDQGSTKRCAGYVVDHVCPLACGGPDATTNMQWQDDSGGKAKDRWERTEIGCALMCR